MVYCDKCKTEIREETKFCPNCGNESIKNLAPVEPPLPPPRPSAYPQQPQNYQPAIKPKSGISTGGIIAIIIVCIVMVIGVVVFAVVIFSSIGNVEF